MRIPVSVEPSPLDLALFHLELAQARYDKAKAARLACVREARDAGLTFQQIADALGMTPAGVRHMLRRAGDA